MQLILNIVVILLAIPVGYLIAYLCKDELVAGRRYFRGLVIAGFVLGVTFYLFGYSVIALTCFFIVIVSFISYIKGNDKTWTNHK